MSNTSWIIPSVEMTTMSEGMLCLWAVLVQ